MAKTKTNDEKVALYKQACVSEIISAVGSVPNRSWDVICAIVQAIASKDASATAIWYDDYRKGPLSKLDTWSTYDRCFNIFFFMSGPVLKANVLIYNGNNYNGNRTKLRFKATVTLPRTFLNKIENSAQYALDEHLDSEYEKHLEEQARIWKAKLRSKITKLPPLEGSPYLMVPKKRKS